MNRVIKISILFGALILAGLIFSQQRWVYDSSDKKDSKDFGVTTNTDASQQDDNSGQKSSLIGVTCPNFNSRPYAIFLENDPIARPLSGISSADLVIEMPVYAGITRLLAFYQCDKPSEVGSIRSARYDFITLAKNFDAILVHFGGEQSALELLSKAVIDNIDGLDYDGVYFYRKQRLKPPHNVFTDFSLLDKVRNKLGYRSDVTVNWREDRLEKPKEIEDVIFNDGAIKPQEIRINYGSNYDVIWSYDPETKNYLRLRAGTPETDNVNKNKVAAKNIIILEVKSKLLDDQYNSVGVIGEGKLWYFVDNISQEGTWYKKDFNSKLEFFDKEGNRLNIKAGKTWLEYIDQNSPFIYN